AWIWTRTMKAGERHGRLLKERQRWGLIARMRIARRMKTLLRGVRAMLWKSMMRTMCRPAR
ncbi:hypothetical protein GGH14_005441, partial [Coemansia sp. RSA 370]